MQKWKDGGTPPVLQATFTDVLADEEGAEKDIAPSSTKCRGPVDSTAGVQELGEHKESLPWSFLCPDGADQELDETACWQIAARKLQMMQDQAEAIRKEEELAASLGE